MSLGIYKFKEKEIEKWFGAGPLEDLPLYFGFYIWKHTKFWRLSTVQNFS
jgi:hypothetical protein